MGQRTSSPIVTIFFIGVVSTIFMLVTSKQKAGSVSSYFSFFRFIYIKGFYTFFLSMVSKRFFFLFTGVFVPNYILLRGFF